MTLHRVALSECAAVAQVRVSGAKNSILPILLSTLLIGGESLIENAPTRTGDFRAACSLLEFLGVRVFACHTTSVVRLSNRELDYRPVPAELAHTTRYSLLIAACLAARFGRAELSRPGGCAFGGDRPIDVHLSGFIHFGCEVCADQGGIVILAKGCNHAGPFRLRYPSVSATLNLALFLVGSGRCGTLENCAIEPEVVDTLSFLSACGADIEGIGTRQLRFSRTKELRGCRWRIIGDRIEAGTFALLSVIRRVNAKIGPVEWPHISSTAALLARINVPADFESSTKTLSVYSADADHLLPIRIATDVFPGFPTDLQPLASATALTIPGRSVISDTVFPERFAYVTELVKTGAKIRRLGNSATVEYSPKIAGARLHCIDLRGGMACLFASALTETPSIVGRIGQVKRGYNLLEEKLSQFGLSLEHVEPCYA